MYHILTKLHIDWTTSQHTTTKPLPYLHPTLQYITFTVSYNTTPSTFLLKMENSQFPPKLLK